MSATESSPRSLLADWWGQTSPWFRLCVVGLAAFGLGLLLPGGSWRSGIAAYAAALLATTAAGAFRPQRLWVSLLIAAGLPVAALFLTAGLFGLPPSGVGDALDLVQAEPMESAKLLAEAAKYGQTERVAQLLESGAPAGWPDRHNVQPIVWASRNGHREVVDLLLAAGAEANAADRNDAPALVVAIREEHSAIARALLSAGADPNSLNRNGESALHYAADAGNGDLIRTLIAFGADVDSTSGRGRTPLAGAARRGHLEVAGLLLEAGATIDRGTAATLHPLYAAVSSGDPAMVAYLLSWLDDLPADVREACADRSRRLRRDRDAKGQRRFTVIAALLSMFRVGATAEELLRGQGLAEDILAGLPRPPGV